MNNSRDLSRAIVLGSACSFLAVSSWAVVRDDSRALASAFIVLVLALSMALALFTVTSLVDLASRLPSKLTLFGLDRRLAFLFAPPIVLLILTSRGWWSLGFRVGIGLAILCILRMLGGTNSKLVDLVFRFFRGDRS